MNFIKIPSLTEKLNKKKWLRIFQNQLSQLGTTLNKKHTNDEDDKT